MVQVPNGEWLHEDLKVIRAEIVELRTDMNERFDKIEVRLDNHSLAMKEHEHRIIALENRWDSVRSAGWKMLTVLVTLLGIIVAWIKGGD